VAIKRVSAKEAVPLQRIGYVFIDVRTPDEYAGGHPKGAINLPWMRTAGFEMKNNADFVPMLEKLYPDKEQKLLLVGKIGKRSLAAAEALEAAGYSDVVELRPGFLGLVDDRGRYTEEGWKGLGLPSEPTTHGGSYAELLKKTDTSPAPKVPARPSQRPSGPGGIQRVSAKAAVPLQKIGCVFIDVRTTDEYATGHPVGAVNIPWQHVKGFDMIENPDFVPIVQKLYPDKGRKLLLVGKIGKRSLAAAKALAEAGYKELVDLRPGFLGLVDDRGRYTEDGWKGLGLPCENTTEDGSYAELRERAGL
jgi:rhodanese-related sulfurtransferase